jgi:hypothetical protein
VSYRRFPAETRKRQLKSVKPCCKDHLVEWSCGCSWGCDVCWASFECSECYAKYDFTVGKEVKAGVA